VVVVSLVVLETRTFPTKERIWCSTGARLSVCEVEERSVETARMVAAMCGVQLSLNSLESPIVAPPAAAAAQQLLTTTSHHITTASSPSWQPPGYRLGPRACCWQNHTTVHALHAEAEAGSDPSEQAAHLLLPLPVTIQALAWISTLDNACIRIFANDPSHDG
jgi:hypothetical protein